MDLGIRGRVALVGASGRGLGLATGMDRALELVADRAAQSGISAQEELERAASAVPIGRLARPEEQAPAAAFLASQMAGYIAGRSLLVDGGAVKAL